MSEDSVAPCLGHEGASPQLDRGERIRAWDELERLAHARRTSRHFHLALTRAFGELEPRLAARLERELERRSLQPGERLFELGERGQDAYLVISGALRIQAQDQLYGEIGPGELVGEMALMRDGPRTAQVVALRTTQLARVDRRVLITLMREQPERAMSAIGRLFDRLHRRGALGRQMPQVMTLVPACAQTDVRAFAEQLRRAFAGRTTHVVDLRTIEQEGVVRGARALGPDASAWRRLSTWLEERRQAEQLVLLIAELDAPVWLSRCMAEAGRVIVVGRGAQPPPPQLLAGLRATRDRLALRERAGGAPLWCVLLHSPAVADPTDTRAWIEALEPVAHHHLREGSARDFARFLRFLRGEARGLALSGGAMRGAAHVGVYAALREFGLDVDYIVGTSAGAMAAAMIAGDRSAEHTRALLFDMLRRYGPPWRSMTLPLISLMRGRLEAVFRETWGERGFEDAWIPSAVVAANLTTGREHVFETGPIWRGLLASCSPPGIMEPVLFDGQLYCDGGLVDNLPVDVLLRRGCGYTIGSNVGLGLGRRMPHTKVPSPWRLLLDRIAGRRREPAFPGLAEIAVRAMGITSNSRLHHAIARTDLLISPPVDVFCATSYRQVGAIVDAGYTHTRAFLRDYEGELPRP